MSEFLRDYLTVAIFAAVAIGLLLVVLALGKLIRPVRPQADKYLTYESGVDAVGTAWDQTPVRYYVFALLFVLFDVEAAFLIPWAVAFRDLVGQGMLLVATVDILVFFAVIGSALVYAWRKGAMKWV